MLEGVVRLTVLNTFDLRDMFALYPLRVSLILKTFSTFEF